MSGSPLTGLDRNRLRRWLILFFFALLIPTAILINQAYRQIKWETFHHYRLLAEDLATRIDSRVDNLAGNEEARSFSDYAFLVVAGDPAVNFVQRSPLSAYPVDALIPGLIGYFQIDTQGGFSSPLLPGADTQPNSYGIGTEELANRQALADRIQQILGENRLVQDTPGPEKTDKTARLRQRPDEPAASTLQSADAPEYGARDERMPGQAAFDRLNQAFTQRESGKRQKAAGALGRVEDLELDDRYRSAPEERLQRMFVTPDTPAAKQRSTRRERSAVPEPQTTSAEALAEARAPPATRAGHPARIRIFESEIEPFEFSLLDSGHFVLYRKVWRDGERYIQGALIEQQPFFNGVIETTFRSTALAQMSDLIVAWHGDVLSALSGQESRGYLSSASELGGALLYRTRLSAPFDALELIFSINRLPAGPGSSLITWVALVLVGVLCAGFLLIYRLGARQIDLARQQQDFVSAVSHELKTPLTSIRMYGEMLREGWAPEDKRKIYYDFIFEESERLSRLISNVLQLARMTRNDLQADLKPRTAGELVDAVYSKIASQTGRAGFELHLACDEAARRAVIQIDTDFFIQIVINLVDNAIKFSAHTGKNRIDIGCTLQGNRTVLFGIRDYGPGVPADQMKKIFALFYRSGNELTRETVGTGIGLALVHQLTQAMLGTVDVVNRNPGAEFRLAFPVCTLATHPAGAC